MRASDLNRSRFARSWKNRFKDRPPITWSGYLKEYESGVRILSGVPFKSYRVLLVAQNLVPFLMFTPINRETGRFFGFRMVRFKRDATKCMVMDHTALSPPPL